MANKLFAVEITYKAYVLAEDYFEAQGFASEITDTEDPVIDAHEVHANLLGWHPESLMYHNGAGDITLREALESVK
jgi:hypothetical protein